METISPQDQTKPPPKRKLHTKSMSTDNKKCENSSKNIDKLSVFYKNYNRIELRERFIRKRIVFYLILICLCALFLATIYSFIKAEILSGIILLSFFLFVLGIIIAYFINDYQDDKHSVLFIISDTLIKLFRH